MNDAGDAVECDGDLVGRVGDALWVPGLLVGRIGGGGQSQGRVGQCSAFNFVFAVLSKTKFGNASRT